MFGSSEKCTRCGKSVYANDNPMKIGPSDDIQIYHPQCFTCAKSGTKLSHRTAVYHKGEIYERSKVPKDQYHGSDGKDSLTAHIAATQSLASSARVEQKIVFSSSGFAHIPDHIKKAETGLGKTKRMDTAASGTSGFSHIPDHIAKAKTMTGYAARGMYQGGSGFAHIPDHIKKADAGLGSPTKGYRGQSSSFSHVPDHIQKAETGLGRVGTYTGATSGYSHIPDHIKNKPDTGAVISSATYNQGIRMEGSAHIPDHIKKAETGLGRVGTYTGATSGYSHIPDHIKNKPDTGAVISSATYDQGRTSFSHVPDHVKQAETGFSGARQLTGDVGATRRGSASIDNYPDELGRN